MKKLLVSLIALNSYSTLHTETTTTTEEAATATAAVHHKRHKTVFAQHTDLLSKLDGNFIGAAEIHNSIGAIKAINEVQYGTLNKQTKKREGTYTYGTKLVTLQDLVKEEHRLTKENISKTDAQCINLNAALTQAKDDFNAKLKALRTSSDKESDMAKNMKDKLIAIFVKDQKRETSLLTNSGKADEKERMYAASATDFFHFLNDLKFFLEDLTDACPKAHEQYKALVRQAHQQK